MPDCDMVLVHDDDLAHIPGYGVREVSEHLNVSFVC